jgi:hypothetical protein
MPEGESNKIVKGLLEKNCLTPAEHNLEKRKYPAES